ncbi:MAG: sigma-70 family RNA polymerase sigma factor [Phycisphaera sp.]|nr:sigma-70 family RNA polymerase sigma factor [Phycisphaera sp.]
MSTSTCQAGNFADEPTLLAALQGGDDRAYHFLVVTHSPHLLAVSRRFMRNEVDAQDVLQDAFLSAFKALPSFRGDAKLSTWLHSIVVRAALMKLRARKPQWKRELSIDDVLPRFSDGFDHRDNPGPAWRSTVEQELHSKEVCSLVRQAIDRLPEIYRVVVMLRDIDGLDTQETAELLGVTTTVIKTRLHRARMALRELLDPSLAGV